MSNAIKKKKNTKQRCKHAVSNIILIFAATKIYDAIFKKYIFAKR